MSIPLSSTFSHSLSAILLQLLPPRRVNRMCLEWLADGLVSPFVPQQKRQRPKTSQDRKYKLENKSTYLEQAKARESGKIIMLRHPIPSTKLPPYVAFICFRVNFALTLLLFSGASQSRARLFHNFHFDFLVVNLLLLYVCRLSYTKNQNLPSNAERKKKKKGSWRLVVKKRGRRAALSDYGLQASLSPSLSFELL